MSSKKLTKKLRQAAYEQFVLKQDVDWHDCIKSIKKSGLDPELALAGATAHIVHRRRRRGEQSTLRLIGGPNTKVLEVMTLANDMAAALEPEEGWPDDSIEQRLLEQDEFLKCSAPHLIPDLAKIVHDYI
jgi:hypothetical protein